MATRILTKDELIHAVFLGDSQRYVPLDSTKVPGELRAIIQYASTWGSEREEAAVYAVPGMADVELAKNLVGVHDDHVELLEQWLAGDAASGPEYSKEYLCFTAFVMAAEYARSVVFSE
jgi:hypothetical protein